MPNAIKDSNNVPVMIGILNTDGSTVSLIYATPAHLLNIDDNTTGSDNGPINAKRDENVETVLMAVSSSDGVTPVCLYVDSSNNLLVDST